MKYNKNEYTKDRPTRTNYFRLEIWCFYVGWPFLYVGAMQKAEFIVIAQFYHKLMWLCALFCCSKKKHTNTHSHNLQPNEVDACYACVFRPSISEWLWFWDTFASGTRYFEYVNDNKTEDPHTSCACVCWTLAFIVYVLSVSKNVKLPQLSHLSYVIS